MIPQEYINKIFDKIGKANLANALNISDEIREYYSADELFSGLIAKCNEEVIDNPEKCKKIVEVISKWSSYYYSDVAYNKNIILDNFIMELCSAMRSL